MTVSERLAKLPIKHKLTLSTLGIALISLLVMSGAFISSEFVIKKKTLRESATTLTRILAVNSTAAVAFHDAEAATEVLAALKAELDAISATIYDLQGQPFVHYHNAALSHDHHHRDKPQSPLDIGQQPFNRAEFKSGYMVVYWDIKESGRLIGFIEVNFSLLELEQSLTKLLLIGLFSSVIALAMAFFVSARSQRFISYPIEVLVDTMAQITVEKDYSRRADKYTDDELGKLTEGFNAMLEQIQNREAQLEKAKVQAEQGSQEKTLFLSRMSHELRTPLNAIIGFSTLLQMKHTEHTTDSEKKSTEHILLAGRHLLMLINDIMEIVSSEQVTDIALQDCILRETIAQSISLVQNQAQENNIQLDVDDTALCVIANHDRLKQVLVNLLTNGIKYNRVAGSLSVKISELGDTVDIMVIDTGVGIEEKDQQAIFEPFNRLAYAEHHEIQGTGIGLALSKFLVQQMKGTISLESDLGVGTTFHLVFPKSKLLVEAPTVAASIVNAELLNAQVSAQDQQGKHKVLYIEDNRASRDLVVALMTEYPEVILYTASTAEEGIDLALAESPDLFFIDINLPQMSGLSAVQILRDNPKFTDSTIYALSADVLPDQIHKAMSAGFDAYLTKPLEVTKFIQVIDKL